MKSLLLKRFLLLIFIVAILSSCSITPRYHSFGYHLEWKSRIAQQTKPSASPLSNESQKRSQGETVEIEQAAHHPFTQPQTPIEKQENYRQEIGNTFGTINMRLGLELQSDTQNLETDSIKPRVVKKENKHPDLQRVNNKIWATNVILLADAISTPLLIRNNRDNETYGFIIYVLLVAPLIFVLVLWNRIRLGVKRRKLRYMANMSDKIAMYNLRLAYDSAIWSVILAPLIITTPLLYFIMKQIFKAIEKREPNNPFVQRENRKINRLYILSAIVSLASLILFLLYY